MKLFNQGASKITYKDSEDPNHKSPHKTGELIGEFAPKGFVEVSAKTGAYLKKLYPNTVKTLDDEKQVFAQAQPVKAVPAAPARDAKTPKDLAQNEVAKTTEEDLKLEAETRGMSLEDLKAEKELLAEEAAKKTA